VVELKVGFAEKIADKDLAFRPDRMHVLSADLDLEEMIADMVVRLRHFAHASAGGLASFNSC
jgi:hypothetical protein